MEQTIVVHRLVLDMGSQAVQATITLAQYDTATHRLIVTLRDGIEPVDLPPGSYAIAVQDKENGVDVLDTVTVYGSDSAYPNSIFYDVTPAITSVGGYHEAKFLIAYVEKGSEELKTMESPRIAFVVKPEMLQGSDVKKSNPFAAVVAAQNAAEKAQAKAEDAKNAAEAVGVVEEVFLNDNGGLHFKFADGREFDTKSVIGPIGLQGPPGVQGKPGDGFKISKTYRSVSAMNAGFSSDGVLEGGFVLIVTGSVEDLENAQLYVKGAEAYEYLCDLSGAPGIQGPEGPQGKSGDDGVSPTVDVSEISGGHRVTIIDANGAKSFDVLDGKSSGQGETTVTTVGESLMSTLLYRGTMGVVDGYDGDIVNRFSVQLADELQPNTMYAIAVNGEIRTYTSDANGEIYTDLFYHDPYQFSLSISGKTMRFESSDIYDCIGSGNWPVNELGALITVSGPSAMVCLGAIDMSGSFASSHLLHFQPQKYSTLYFSVQEGDAVSDIIEAVPLDENGGIQDGADAVVGCCSGENIYASIEAGTLHWRTENDNMIYNGILYVYTEAGNVTGGVVANSSGSSPSGSAGGGTRTYYISSDAYSVDSFCELDWDKRYLIRATCPQYGNSTHTYIIVFDQGSMYSVGDNWEDTFSLYLDGAALSIYVYQDVMVEITELVDFTPISCFIEGTKVLLRDPVTKVFYEKNIEDVKPFEYAAWWNPAKGRLDGTRIVAPPIVGDAEEYDLVYFSDGTVLKVFGVQLFWDVDKDDLIDWQKMAPGTRVCTQSGDIVEFVKSEHVVPEVPTKHYTLLTFRGRYIADGIMAADKRDLICPRLHRPEYLKYWRMLSEKDRAQLREIHKAGMRRRNWKFSKEYVDVKRDYREQRRALKDEKTQAETHLGGTDYQVIKLTEGVLSEEEFAPVRQSRAAARETVNRCRAELAALDPLEADALEAVHQAAKSTYVPKFAGKFVGKNKVILD